MMQRSSGFTLIEIVVAMAVFGLMVAIAYAGLDAILRHKGRMGERSDHLVRLQKSMHLMQQDLMFATKRGIRDELGTPEPALVGGQGEVMLSLTRASLAHGQDSGLIRVDYLFSEGSLQRRLWPVLDRTPSSTPLSHELLVGVESVERRFLDTGDWYNSWPVSGRSDVVSGRLPRAMEVVFHMEDGDRFRRIFPISSRG